MVLFGYQMWQQAFHLMHLTDTGLIPIMAGPGYLISTGAGRLSIMEGGTITKFTDGTGFLIIPGDQHGLTGPTAPAITDGVLWRPVST